MVSSWLPFVAYSVSLASIASLGRAATTVPDYDPSNYTCPVWQCVFRSNFVCQYIDLSDWYNLTQYTDCNNGVPPYNISVASGTKRIRRNILSLDDSDLVKLMKAVSCSYYLGSNQSSVEENGFFYTLTYHGEPNWFDECNDKKNGHNQGQGDQGCCTHMKPNFFTWHRLFMTSIENSLRMWDLDIGLPYLEWTDYEYSSEKIMPTLLTNISFFDDDGTEYRNPFYNFQLPNEIRQVRPETTCEFSLVDGTDAFFELTHASNDFSFFKQIYHSLFYSNWVAFDFMNEVPHNNVHDLVSGTMTPPEISSYAPFFMLHHSAVEKYFLIWQTIMADVFEIDYKDRNVQDANFGCFRKALFMDEYLAPFHSSETTNDPIVVQNAGNGFGPIEWEVFNYEYDEYNIGPMSYNETVRDLCLFFDKGTGKYPKCDEYVDSYDTASGYNATQFLGWYLRLDNNGLIIYYDIYDYSDDSLITSSQFASLMSTNAWEEAGGQFLYRVDITDELNKAGRSIADDILIVRYNISVRVGDTWYDCVYLDTSCEYYDYIDYPIFIYQNEDGSSETHQIHIGLNDTHIYSRDSNIIFGTSNSISERHENTTVELKLFDVQSNTANTADTANYVTDNYLDFLSELLISNEYFTTVETEFLLYLETYVNTIEAETLALVGTNPTYVTNVYLKYFSNVSDIGYTSEDSRLEWTVLDYESQNYFQYGDFAYIGTWSDLSSYQGFDGSVFTSANVSGNAYGLEQFAQSNTVPGGAATQVTLLNLPWEPFFTHTQSTVYGQNHLMTGWHSGDSISFICCDEYSSTCSSACLTDDVNVYDTCDLSGINEATDCGFTFNCGAASSCGNTQRPTFESGKTYYFVSSNETFCMDGLEIAFTFDTVEEECNTPITPGCDPLRAGLKADTLTDTDGFAITAKEDCLTDYTLRGPQSDGWFAYAFYGTYTESGTTKMNGYAIVVQYCSAAITINGRSENVRITQQQLSQGTHTELCDITDQCDVKMVNNVIEANCTDIERKSSDFQDIQKLIKNFTVEAGTPYYHLSAEYQAGNCTFEFGAKQQHNSPPQQSQYTYSEYETDETPIMMNVTENMDMETTMADDDTDVAYMQHLDVNVSLIAFVLFCVAMREW